MDDWMDGRMDGSHPNPFVYIMFKIGLKNKKYGISFEVATSSQTKL
jgi:hypothetical protein